ncbi:MAG: 50S ribosomal protein L11 methyltransferase [Clostridiales bacterium]|nr:50S ribosomal protein L11 methyltransferase [Clostridiales bacterium]
MPITGSVRPLRPPALLFWRRAPAIPPLLAENGRFIASGIIDERSAEVQECLQELGFAVERVYEADGWVAIQAHC